MEMPATATYELWGREWAHVKLVLEKFDEIWRCFLDVTYK